MTPLNLLTVAHYLPDNRALTEAAIAEGRYSEPEDQKDGYRSVAVEEHLYPFDMAHSAATAGLETLAMTGTDLHGLVFSHIHRHGHPRLWSPAFGLQRQLGLRPQFPVLSLAQGCNGLMSGLAALAPSVGPAPTLFVGADRFSGSGFDRWRSDYGLVYGDAAAAFLVSRDSGPSATSFGAGGRLGRILHLGIEGVPAVEEMHRGAAPEPEDSNSWIRENNVRQTKKRFLETQGRAGFVAPLMSALGRLREGLEHSPHWSGRASWLLPPLVGNGIREATYEATFGPLAQESGWQIGRELGHMGTTDGWVVLSLLKERQLLASGDQVILLSAGVGFSCGLALIEID